METKNIQNQSVSKINANEIVKQVENSVIELTARGGLQLPKDYSASNALRAAALILQEVIDKDKRPALEVCTRTSIINSLLNMVVQGLNPIRKQCYFVVFGNKLSLMRSYMGNIMLAKRVGLKQINANVVYKGDIFEFSIDDFGCYRIEKHHQKLENIDRGEIIAAYAVYELENGFKNTVIMTISQIKKAWLQGYVYSENKETTHSKFTDEMAKKTVINRACKLIINASPDLSDDEVNENDVELAESNYEEIIDTEESESEVLNFEESKKVEEKVEKKSDDKEPKIPF